MEYLLKRRLEAAADAGVAGIGGPTVLPGVGEIVHIFCTSEDINNLTYALTIRSAVEEVWLPAARGLVADLSAMAQLTTNIEWFDSESIDENATVTDAAGRLKRNVYFQPLK